MREDDIRMRTAATILDEFRKYPLNNMPKLRERFLRGDVFGTVLNVTWEDGSCGDVLAFDLDRDCYVMSKKDFYHFSQKLTDFLMEYHLLSKRNGEFEC